MSRTILAVVMAILMAVTSLAGSAVAAEAPASVPLKLSGKLTFETVPSVPHYELNGYVLIHKDPDQLKAFLEREVVVTGTLVDTPSIYMTKVLQVEEIRAREGLPVPIPGPGAGDKVTIPMLPPGGSDGDGPPPSDLITIPELPPRATLPVIITPRPPVAIYLPPVREIGVWLRGKRVKMDQQPFISNGRTLVGLRAIAEALGADVTWDAETRTATITLNDRQVLVTIGQPQVILRHAGKPDVTVAGDVAPVLVGARTMVPVRILSESLGLTVSWDDATRTVNLE